MYNGTNLAINSKIISVTNYPFFSLNIRKRTLELALFDVYDRIFAVSSLV